MTPLLSELRRRNVFRVGTAYLVFSWLIIQITDTIAPPLGLPGWTLSLVVWLSVVGFPFALLIAWAFELTPEGVKRSADVPADESTRRRIRIRWNVVIITLMAAVIMVLLVDRFWLQSDAKSTDLKPSTSESIAVLPFTNLSDDPDNEFFADGLAEELLNLLAQVDGLKVSARTSSFYFKGKNPTIAEVAEALDVDTIVEGSVRRSGDTIRVVVQLISADDSAHLWSERYDRPLTELFAVQDDMANQIVAELMPHLDGSGMPPVTSDTGSISPATFERFLLARQRYHDATDESRAVARDGFLAVTQASPDYAPAWAWLARCWISLAGRLEIDPGDARRAAEVAIDTAFALDPNQAMAFVARGRLLESEDLYEEALENFDQAIASDRNLVEAHIGRQDALVSLGQPGPAIESLQQARSIDPLHPEVLESLAHLLNLKGQRGEAMEAIRTFWLVNPTAAASLEAHIYGDDGDYARALYMLEEFSTAGADDLTYYAILLGLHDEPIIQQTTYRPVSLAVQGRRKEALAELAIVKQGTDSAHFRADMEYQTMVVLGEFATAKDLLWDRWASQGGDNPGPGLGIPDLVALAGLMRKSDEVERIAPVIDELCETVSTLSPDHAGAYHHLNGYCALLSGDIDKGLEHFERLVAMGDAGLGVYGTVQLVPWLFEGDSRLESITERLLDNRNTQVDELNRYRAEAFSLERVREEYVAGVADQP